MDARIWTGHPDQPEAQALAIRDDRIVAVGSDEEVQAWVGPETRVESLDGRRVLPGFHDAHWHLPTRATADLTAAGSVDEIVRRLEAWAAGLGAGLAGDRADDLSQRWITGRGWTPDMFPAGAPHRSYLEEAFPDTPVLLTDRDGHLVLANGRALELAGVTGETPSPPGGEVELDGAGEPTGVLKETAMGLVRGLLPPPTEEEVYRLLLDEMQRAASLGLTALQVANAPSPPAQAAFLRALQEDSLHVRLRIAVPFQRDASLRDLVRWTTLRDEHTGPYLRFGTAKGMLDGTVDGGTAAMLEPYAVGGGRGIPMWEPHELAQAVARYDSAGLQIQLHAIGDGAIRMALDAFQALPDPNARRHRIEHLEVPHPDDLPRFAAMGVLASTQAIFATPDATTLTNYAPRLGPDRAARAMPFRSLDQAGAVQAFGSDHPVFPMDPLLGVYTAVTRQLPDGTPQGGWEPHERITLEAALRHYTWGSAYAAFREEELGTLQPGMMADLVVLSDEILGEPPSALLTTRPVLTMMGGRVTWRVPDV